MATINQKEYLKKYLSIGSVHSKKKKKKKVIKSERLKIIDVDDDVKTFTKSVEEDLMGNDEDAPQIVGIIDDRPLELKMQDYQKSGLWKPALTNDEDVLILQTEGSNDREQENGTNSFKTNIKQEALSPPSSPIRNQQNFENPSPPRRRKRDNDKHPDVSPPRRKGSDRNNISPERINPRDKLSFRIKMERTSPAGDDLSPPRKRRNNDDLSPPRKHRSKNDLSPPRRHRSKDDLSPPRRHRSKDDFSPPRTNRNKSDPLRKHRNNEDFSPPRKRGNKDNLSPPRKHRNREDDLSPPRSKRERNHTRWESSSRRSTSKNSHRSSPTVIVKQEDISPPRRRQPSPDMSPFSSRQGSSTENKLAKTLDGRKAGLQNAEELVKENEAFKKREDDLFKQMSTQVSGENAAPIMRDRRTGKKRNLEEEAEKEKEKQRKKTENKEKYDKWGKGLKQVEDYNEKLKQDLLEMNKPLARYADDEDLEKYLKEQEREGDPMLNYIRKKKKKDQIKEGKPSKPQYEGEFMPNRYGIKPGHRWDGVDRSNGYEKRWFEVQNAKRATQEEIYKWSTEDM